MDTLQKNWAGKWALVTGASAGIGRELATLLASGGTNLVLTARRRERLDELATNLRAKHYIKVEVFTADLTKPSAPTAIFNFTRTNNITIDLLINNAGFGSYGPFHESDLARQLEMIQVNCSAVVHLTHLYLAGMIERRRGDILTLGSTASFQAVPYIATYAATKAFDLSFGEALAEEVRQFGIRACVLCPGSTQTEFHEVAGHPRKILPHQETADKVARVGLEALAEGKSLVISGIQNNLGAAAQRLVPRSTVTKVAGKVFAPKTPARSRAKGA
jgi:hypothetical protein